MRWPWQEAVDWSEDLTGISVETWAGLQERALRGFEIDQA